MFQRKKISQLAIVALVVMATPLGSTGAPESVLDQATQLGTHPMHTAPGGTVTDLHLIAFSRDMTAD